MTSKKSFYITTPIYYVNDAPHIGHAYTTLACDTMAHYKRLASYDVKFLTGTDEHGQKVEKAAKDADMEPQAFVDKVSQTFRHLANEMQITNDDFIRTTEPRHIKAAQNLWQELIKRGEIYLGSYAGWYAVRDEAFYAESELIDGKAPTGAPVEWVTEPSYFFKLSAWQDRLLDFYEKNPDFIQPESRRNEVLSFVKGGLLDLSVSRTSFKWGVPVPGDPDHVMYVWLDALTNYITALGYPDINSDDFKKFWPESVHVVGKDILRFHAVYWPAFLMAAGLPAPRKIVAHGWWTIEGVKMSKSLGNSINPFAESTIFGLSDRSLLDTLSSVYGYDNLRYFLLREISFGQDGDFSFEAFKNRYNSDLANSYGNLVQRVLSFIYKQCDGKVPEYGEFTKEDLILLQEADSLPAILEKDMETFAFHKYAEHIWQIIFKANQYVDEQKPWGLKTTDQARMKTILYVLAETIRKLAILTQPILPDPSERILDQLSIPDDRRDFGSFTLILIAGTSLPEPKGVFPRLPIKAEEFLTINWGSIINEFKGQLLMSDKEMKEIKEILKRVKIRGSERIKDAYVDLEKNVVILPGIIQMSFYRTHNDFFSPAMYRLLGPNNYPNEENDKELLEDAIYCFSEEWKKKKYWPS